MWDLWWTLGQIFLLMRRFSPVNFIPPMLGTHLRQDGAVTKRTFVRSLERYKKQCRLGNRRALNRKLLSFFFFCTFCGVWMLVLFKICSPSSSDVYMLAWDHGLVVAWRMKSLISAFVDSVPNWQRGIVCN